MGRTARVTAMGEGGGARAAVGYGRLRRWLRRRRAQKARLAHAAWDLSERYGGAAAIIARNSARQAVGLEGRRFWAAVAVRIERTSTLAT